MLNFSMSLIAEAEAFYDTFIGVKNTQAKWKRSWITYMILYLWKIYILIHGNHSWTVCQGHTFCSKMLCCLTKVFHEKHIFFHQKSISEGQKKFQKGLEMIPEWLIAQ